MALKKRLDLKIPVKAISTNKLYSGRKVRSWYYKEFRKQVFKFLEDNYPEPVELGGNLVLEMEVGFSSTLNDCSNSIKGIEDIIAEFYKFNDRQIVSVRVDKYLVDKGKEYTHVLVRKTRKNIDRRTKNARRSKR